MSAETMDKETVRAFIQARMSSKRFPGKVLAPLKGQPLIAHVIAQVARVIPAERITVATSTKSSDDPLACYVREVGISVYRGPLDDVFKRFQLCLKEYPCSWFFRLCADSPLLDGTLLQGMLTYCHRSDIDLVTNVYPRTFPKGRSVEMLYSATFAALDVDPLSAEETEHMTKVYYDHPERFRIINIESTNATLAKLHLTVDTVEDLFRLETFLQESQPSAEVLPSVGGKHS